MSIYTPIDTTDHIGCVDNNPAVAVVEDYDIGIDTFTVSLVSNNSEIVVTVDFPNDKITSEREITYEEACAILEACEASLQ